MDDKSAKDKVKTFIIDINVKYQFTGTENDIERLKNDKDYLKNVCNALLLNKKTGSDKSDTSSDISVTAVNISNAIPKNVQSLDACTTQEYPMSEALEVLATATELQQTRSSESSTPQASMTCSFTENRPASDIIKDSVQARLPSISSVSAIKSPTELRGARTNRCLHVRSRPRPIAIKPLPPTIYGHTSGSQPFVPIILKPVSSSFAFVPQTQVVSTVDTLTIGKPTPCNQPISPQTSEFLAQQKSFLSDQHTFRPVKPNELLLDLYESHLDMFAESKYLRASLWEKVASRMVEHGYSVTGPQCNNRWRYLLATFNKVATSDGESNSFKYFNRIAEILHKKSTMPVIAKTPGVIGEAVLEVLGDEEEGRPVVKKRRRRKEDEKDELIANLSKKMEQLQEMQNEMTTFLSAFKDGVVKKQ